MRPPPEREAQDAAVRGGRRCDRGPAAVRGAAGTEDGVARRTRLARRRGAERRRGPHRLAAVRGMAPADDQPRALTLTATAPGAGAGAKTVMRESSIGAPGF